jgi:hypothetical protein
VTSLVGFIKLFTEGFKMPRKYNLLKWAIHLKKYGGVFGTSLMKAEGMAIIQLGILF